MKINTLLLWFIFLLLFIITSIIFNMELGLNHSCKDYVNTSSSIVPARCFSDFEVKK